MAMEMSVRVRGGYVVVAFTGECPWRNSEQSIENWNRNIAQHWSDPSQTFRLLIDMRRVRGQLSRTGGFRKLLETWIGSRRIKIAWLYGDPENEAYFVYRDTLARHLGFIARSFSDPRRALRWLTDGRR